MSKNNRSLKKKRRKCRNKFEKPTIKRPKDRQTVKKQPNLSNNCQQYRKSTKKPAKTWKNCLKTDKIVEKLTKMTNGQKF